ncbi:MAG: MotA/TolQ/ExbB proton channel family protein [Chthoniobacteraceae bacterium]
MKHCPLSLLALTGIFSFVAPALLLAQEVKGEASASSATTTMWQDLVSGGPVMIVIGICSVATLYLIVDGLLRITNFKKSMPVQHVNALKSLFRAGDYVGAYKFCKGNPSALTNVCRAGLTMVGEGKVATEEAVFGAISKENAKMQYFISYLSVIGVCTPMIGLLGTVFGMKSAFRTLNVSGIGDPGKLSGAIGEVLICTAFGLLIAIPAFFAFYWLRNRAAKLIHNVQEMINSLYRKMPYEYLAGVHIGDDELFAAVPNWVQQAQPEATQA